MPSQSDQEKLTRSRLRSGLNLPTSIDDIRDKEHTGKSLDENEKRALKNFERYRVEYLQNAKNEEDLQRRYFQLRSWANLHNYEDFL